LNTLLSENKMSAQGAYRGRSECGVSVCI